MCGIAGFVGPWPESLLGAMNTALAHRGPDGEGIFHDPAAGIGLAHRRLAIIDLTEAGAQPMASADGRYHITYNGEIYNYRALRDELERGGVDFRSQSDTEVLLALYARDGADCLARLHGIFAFAVWDAQDRRLFVARDPLGVKPLYYAQTANGFLFASELKALVLCPDVARDIDPVAVADHLGFLWTAGEATMLKSVRKLRPGTALTLEGGRVTVQSYWQPPLGKPEPERGVRAPASPDGLAALIDTVVGEQMVADVAVGALLSGGVDSSAIVAAMCRATAPENITTFCAAVSDRGGRADNFGDDLEHARLVAEKFGVKLVEVPTAPDLIGGLAGMVWSLDEPTADFAALQTWTLASAARENGIKVLLSGVGGDDLFTGYGRHRAGMVYALADRVPGARRLLGAVLKRVPASTVAGRRLQRLGQLLALDEDEMLAEAMSFSAVTAEGRMELLAPGLRAEVPGDGIPAPFRDSLARTKGRHPVERFIDLELTGFLPDHNLNYTDKMAMKAGVEVRVPLIAPRLVEFAADLALSDRIDLRRTKKILRDSQTHRLPPAVLTRPKQGFGVPLRAWLHGPARPLLDELTARDVVERRGLFDAGAVARLREAFHAGRIDAALTLFPLMAVELWCRALDAAPTADLT
jgi:asparagine synthase (glutamine-hydrolysing)